MLRFARSQRKARSQIRHLVSWGQSHVRRQEQNGASDRREVAAGEPYEVAYFAKKHGLTRDRAEMLIKKFGNDRATLDAEAEKLKK